MRPTRLLFVLPLVLTIALAACQSDGLTGPAEGNHSSSGPLSPAEGTCDPHQIPC